MSQAIESDAELLWADVVDIMRTNGSSPAITTMLQSCSAQDLTDESLVISTSSRFASRQIQRLTQELESCIEQASFMPLKLVIGEADSTPKKLELDTEVTPEEFTHLASSETKQTTAPAHTPQPQPQPGYSQPRPVSTSAYQQPTTAPCPLTNLERRHRNALISDIGVSDSKLTFERFIEGDENRFALQAAKQVANGENKGYNPLFIYGKSGLGKTHLLKAIQNYIIKCDPDRLCLYRTSKDFQNDYVTALNNQEYSAQEALRQNYYDIDVLIIDDIQNLSGKGTIQFFFDTFNYLSSMGKWVVIAADRTPRELGIGDKGLDERVVSRLGAGMIIPIEVPSDEFKYVLISNFYKQLKIDAETEHTPGCSGTISEDNLKFMAERSGNNIRTISAFCAECLTMASFKEENGADFGREDILKLARNRWNPTQTIITIDTIQKAVESEYSIKRETLIGNKRKKEIMEARHVGIWLTRELTDSTLAEIGEKFGGRTHATVLNSINWVGDNSKEDRLFFDRITRLKEQIEDASLS